MAFNGSGTYNLPAGNPVVTSTTISSTTTNTTNSDIATALTNCITRDGQSTPSANLPMNAKKLTGLAAGTSAGDSVRYEQVLLLTGGTLTGNLTITGANSLRGSYGSGNQSTNFAAGDGSLTSNTTGSSNTASGFQALYSNTTGSSNTASGYQVLAVNTTGSNNTASGVSALTSNTTGINNTASGVNALGSNITGGSNTAIGANALVSNTTGSNNTASGEQALYSNTTGINNTASGKDALVSNTTGASNTASGYQALAANTTGSNNTASGRGALYSNTTGGNNLAIGRDSLYSNTTGNYNIALGGDVFGSITTGSNNVGIGFGCSSSSSTVSNEVNIYNGVVTARFQGSASSWSFVSDVRDKTNIVDLDLGLAFVNKLQPRKFEWGFRHTDVDKGKAASGFIAQEVLNVLEQEDAIFTGLVDTNDSEKYMLAQTNLIPILVNAIKELTARLEILENKGV